MNEKRREYLQKYFSKPEKWEKHLEAAKRYRTRNPSTTWEKRLRVLNHYGDGSPKCICCGEKEIKFLALDHKFGNGNEHRKMAKGNMCWWIIKNNFPDMFQILCHNCNQAKGYYGACPHVGSQSQEKN